MTNNISTLKSFRRVLYTPQYRYYQGVEEVINREIRELVLELDDSVWDSSGSTTIEVTDGLAYGRTEVFRQRTSED